MRVRMVVAYDGSGFHGFAENVGVATVAGTLRRSIERVTGADIQLTGAGRTDAGVHAQGQVVSFDVPDGRLDLTRLARSVNALCGPAIVVRSAAEAPPDFDARHSALWRRYRYTVLNRDVPDPFLARVAWHVPHPLGLAAMRLACDPLIGEHDFSSFCRKPRVGIDEPEPTLVRRVLRCRWDDQGDGVLWFEIVATSFCHQMVRSIVGTMVEVGGGRHTAGEVAGMLRARDRRSAGQVAPPHGLCLLEVGYPS